MNNATNSKANVGKPYPRRCAECGNVSVQPEKVSQTAKIKHDGKVHEIRVNDMPIDRCSDCGEEFFTNATADAKSAALRSHLGLLQPTEIRELLALHDLTQRKFAAHLRVAEETVSRWLNGLSIQSRALDALMRVYFANSDVRHLLSKNEFPNPENLHEYAGHTHGTRHPVFYREFSASIISRSRRFRLVPSRN